MIEVYPVGSPVRFGTFDGHVLRVQIAAGNTVVYEVGWWSGAEWKEGWINSFLVTPNTSAREQIGFSMKACIG